MVGGGVLNILYCGVYILNCGWPHSSSQYIIGAAYTNPPILTDRVNAYRAPDWALFAKIFTSSPLLAELTPLLLPCEPVFTLFFSWLRLGPYLPSSGWVHIYLAREGPTPVIS